MERTFRNRAVSALLLLLACGMMPVAAHAGDGEVLHVGESTTLILDGTGWAFDASKSRQAQLVAVKSAGVKGETQSFSLRGLNPGQATLVFRRGQKTFRASVDVLR